jgi:hypothetical protein
MFVIVDLGNQLLFEFKHLTAWVGAWEPRLSLPAYCAFVRDRHIS